MKDEKQYRCLLSLIMALLCGSFSASTGFEAELSPSAWRQDLDYLADALPKCHKNAFHAISREQFRREVVKLSDRIPDLTDAEIRAGFSRIVALIGDGHTWISALNSSLEFPIGYRQFGDNASEIYAIAADREYSEAIGARLVGVGSYSMEEVIARLRPLALAETPVMFNVYVPALLHNVDALRGTGLWAGGESILLHYERDGRKFSIGVKPARKEEAGPRIVRAPEQLPMYLSNRSTPYWFRMLEDTHALYIQYNSCVDVPSLSFAQFTKQVVESAQRDPVEKVIIDLRLNGGGNNQIMKPLLHALRRDPLRRARLYVITGWMTYSSGTWAACQLKTKCKAIIVGEPSSQKLHAYGDTRTFKLPNSGISVGYAVQFFNFVSKKEDLLIPDLPVPVTVKDYFAGRDTALERILAD
jgi:hypothetical protein